MKKILCFGMGSEKKVGGIEIFLMNMYRNINHQKVQFDFVKTCEGKLYCEDELIANGSKIIKIVSRSKNPIKHYKELNKLFKNNKDYDKIYVNLNTCSCISPIVYANKYNNQIVVHSHNVWNGNKISSKILNKINKKRLQKMNNTNLACSTIAGEYMFGKQPFTVIENGIELENYKFNSNARTKKRKELKLKDKTVFINVGRLCNQKNQTKVIEVFEKYLHIDNNAILLLVGDGSDRKKLEKMIADKHLEKYVHLLGMRNDINELLHAADVFLFPSNFEGLGIALIEAETTGIDCYVSEVIPKEAIISPKVTVCPINMESSKWASKITFNTEDRSSIYDVMMKSGYNIKEAAQKLEKLLKK